MPLHCFSYALEVNAEIEKMEMGEYNQYFLGKKRYMLFAVFSQMLRFVLTMEHTRL